MPGPVRFLRFLVVANKWHDWPSELAQSMHRHALGAPRTPTAYSNLVRSMLQGALVNVDDHLRWPQYRPVWDSLVGIDGYTRTMWAQRHTQLVSGLQDVFHLWMDRIPAEGRRLAGVAVWLMRPPAAQLRFKALRWLVARVCVATCDEPRDVEEAEDAIANLLNVVWLEQQAALSADRVALQAFRSLLAWLVERQNRLGLELVGRLGSLAD